MERSLRTEEPSTVLPFTPPQPPEPRSTGPRLAKWRLPKGRLAKNTSSAAAQTEAETLHFVLRLGEVLHRYGTPAYRLEEALGDVCRSVGLEASFFAGPTALFVSLGRPEQHAGRQAGHQAGTYLIRAEPGDLNLEKLTAVRAVGRSVALGEMTARAGLARLEAIVAAPPRWSPWLTVLCFSLASACAGRFLGAGATELLITLAAGLGVGLLAVLAGSHPALGRVFEATAAVGVTLFALAAAQLLGGLAVETVILGSLIVLLPGLSLTVAMTEIATRNLVSGTARLAGVSVTFLQLAFGVALGYALIAALPGQPLEQVAVAATPLPGWTQLVALLLAPLAFTVLCRSAPREAPWILAASLLAFLGARAGAEAFGANLGAFLGALLLAVASNLAARYRDRPASLTQVPGLMLLVPGSLGFRSLASLLQQDVLTGVQTAFTMTLVAISLVAGLLLANVLVPPRGAL